MSWVQTSCGCAFDFGALVYDIRWDDVAHHLAKIDRFNGAAPRLYSVAEHSLLVSEELVYRRYRHSGLIDSIKARMYLLGLLHDAAEAYIGDIVSPLKHSLDFVSNNVVKTLEGTILGQVWDKSGIPPPSETEWIAIRQADLAVLRAEYLAFFAARSPKAWDVPWTEPETAIITRVEPLWTDVKARFLARLNQWLTVLGGNR